MEACLLSLSSKFEPSVAKLNSPLPFIPSVKLIGRGLVGSKRQRARDIVESESEIEIDSAGLNLEGVEGYFGFEIAEAKP
jgi:hypothetical protein